MQKPEVRDCSDLRHGKRERRGGILAPKGTSKPWHKDKEGEAKAKSHKHASTMPGRSQRNSVMIDLDTALLMFSIQFEQLINPTESFYVIVFDLDSNDKIF